MNRLGRMEEEGWRAGGGERRAHLLADDARLAEAHGDDAAGGGVDELHDLDEGVVQMIDEAEDGGGLDFEDALRFDEGGVLGCRWLAHRGRVTLRAAVYGNPRALRSCGSSAPYSASNVGVATPAARAMRTTAPTCASSSDGLPSMMSRCMDAVASGGSASM